MKKVISDRADMIDSSGIRKVFALADTMKDPVNFSIGQPDFDVPGPIKAAASEAVNSGFNSYSQTAGEGELLEKLTAKVSSETKIDDPSVLVTSGVSGGLLLLFMAVINPGDEVIVADPYFVIYKHIINMMGGKCVFVDSYPDFKLPLEGVEGAISDRTKLIILNSPANPTGAVYSDDEIMGAAEIARKHDIVVLSDEIYDEFCYDGKCPSIADYYEKTVLLKGFSKSYAMTGWRVAYAAGGGAVKDILEQMTKIQQYTFVCSPTPFQRAAIAALDVDMSYYVSEYRKKRDMIYDGLSGKFEIVKPGGAFYTFVKAPGRAKNATEFVEKAIANNVLIIPGNVFSEKDTHFRISYATSDDKIKRGIEILNSIAG